MLENVPQVQGAVQDLKEISSTAKLLPPKEVPAVRISRLYGGLRTVGEVQFALILTQISGNSDSGTDVSNPGKLFEPTSHTSTIGSG